jgi:hypothetical protein
MRGAISELGFCDGSLTPFSHIARRSRQAWTSTFHYPVIPAKAAR